MSEIVDQLEKTPCPLDKEHKLRVKKLLKNNFTLWCPDCKEKLKIDNELKGKITSIKKNNKNGIR